MVRLFRIRGGAWASIAVLAVFAVFAPPSHAQSGVVTLTQASKYLEGGSPAKAIELIDKTLISGELSTDYAAKAMLLRAQAHEQLDKYAYALADYNQAIFQGLAGSDKSDAEKGRARIMAKLGVGSGSPSAAPQRTAAVASPAERAPSRAVRSEPAPAPSPPPQETRSSGGFFSSLFSSSAAPAPQPAVEREVERQPAPEPERRRSPQLAGGGAERRSNPPQTARVAVAQVRQTSVSDTSSGQSEDMSRRDAKGGFAIQFAALLSEPKAIYEVNRIEKRYADVLNGRTPLITVKETNEGGTLYKIIAQPYERGEGLATCELLKSKGVNCMVISR